MHVYYINMQNGRILILIVLDKNIDILLGHSLPSYYALDFIAILYKCYANIVQWLYMQIYFPVVWLLITCISPSIDILLQ